MKQKWEYLWNPVVPGESLKNHLDAVGDDGWELISLVKVESKDADNSTPVYHAIFKRPK